MESIRARYRDLTGRDPGRVIVLQDGDLSEFYKVFNIQPARHLGETSGETFQEEFLELTKTAKGYNVRGFDLQKGPDGNLYETYFEEDQIPEGIVGDALKGLDFGDSLTLHFVGDDAGAISKKRAKYVHPNLDLCNVTMGPREDLSKENQLAALSKRFSVKNKYGIHARPAASIVNYLNKVIDPETEVYLEKEGMPRVSGRSIMGLLTLGAIEGDLITVTAQGKVASEAIGGLEKMFISGFGELNN